MFRIQNCNAVTFGNINIYAVAIEEDVLHIFLKQKGVKMSITHPKQYYCPRAQLNLLVGMYSLEDI